MMVGSGLFLIFTCILSFFIGRYFYNNAYEIYDYEKSKANNWFKRLVLKLNTPSKLKFMGILLMLLGFLGTIVLSFFIIRKLLQ